MTVTLDRKVENFIGAPRQLFINGQWVDAASGKTFETLNPATGETLAHVAEGDAEDIDRAVRAARRAFEDGPWSRMTPSERGRIIWRIGDLILEHTDELAAARIARQRQAARRGARRRRAAGRRPVPLHGRLGDQDRGQHDHISVPYMPGANFHSYTLREPVGVVGQIIPWNFPLLMAAWKLGPALATGCTRRPEARRADAAVGAAAGRADRRRPASPTGVVNVVTGFGETAGAALAAHTGRGQDRVHRLDRGRQADRRRPRPSNLKKVTLELGGKSPEHRLRRRRPRRRDRGRRQRDLLQPGPVLLRRLAAVRPEKPSTTRSSRASRRSPKAIKLGDRRSMPATADGPAGLRGAVATGSPATSSPGSSEGATARDRRRPRRRPRATSSSRPSSPTSTADMKVVREEIFGPVVRRLAVQRRRRGHRRVANDTDYGLAARRLDPRHRQGAHAGQQLAPARSGSTATTSSTRPLPFGGYKQSGWGREMGHQALEAYTEVKAVTTQL